MQYSRQFTPFERLCTQTRPHSRLISSKHNLIFTDLQANESLACRNWEKDLSISLSAGNWKQIFLNIHKGSSNVTAQENRYKIQSRWYRTPALLNKFYPATPETCWRCHQDRGTLLHNWWSCTPLHFPGYLLRLGIFPGPIPTPPLALTTQILTPISGNAHD